jgi:hypothetical protein
VAVGAGEMTPAVPDPVEVARVELVEALARMVNRSIEDGKTSARSALCHIDVLRVILAEVANVEDFRKDLAAAERTLRLYLTT